MCGDMYIRRTNVSNSNMTILRYNTDGGMYLLLSPTNELIFGIMRDDEDEYSETIYQIPSNMLYSILHVAFSYDGQYSKLYLNGINVKTKNHEDMKSINLGISTIISIGRDPTNNEDYFEGNIDEIRLWSRVLSDEEINYYKDKKLKGNEDDLIGYYTLDEESGSVAIDLSSLENNGTIYNGAYIPGEVDLEYDNPMRIISISNTTPWVDDIENIISKHYVDIDDAYSYKVYINDEEELSDDMPESSDILEIILDIDLFNIGNNAVKVELTNEDEIFINEYDIILENRDTFKLERDLRYDISHETYGDVYHKPNHGYIVDNLNIGYVKLNIPTEGKSTIKNITVEDNTNILSDNYVSYLISKDNINWYGYDTTEWIEDYEMNNSEINSITPSIFYELFGHSIYEKEIHIKCILDNKDNFTPTIVRNITVEFEDNTGVYIIDPEIIISDTHNDYATVKATLKDYEGDTIQYRILIKKTNEEDFYVADNWMPVINGHRFTKSYNYPYFNLGNNTIKIEAKDQRNVITSWTGNLTLNNIDPVLNYTYNNFGFHSIISDADLDPVSVQVRINNVIVLPYTEYMQTPAAFSYEWDMMYVPLGEESIVKIEVMDILGGYTSSEFTIVGKHKGLLFKNKEGELYSTGKRNILKILNVGRVIAGKFIQPIKITLLNNTSDNLDNIKLKYSRGGLPENARVLFSKNANFSNPEEELLITSLLLNEDETDFYVSVVAEDNGVTEVIDASFSIIVERSKLI